MCIRDRVALGELGDRLLQLQYGAGQAPGEQQTERGADQHGDAQDLDGVIQDLDEEEQVGAVSYTHLDVYKRQRRRRGGRWGPLARS